MATWCGTAGILVRRLRDLWFGAGSMPRAPGPGARSARSGRSRRSQRLSAGRRPGLKDGHYYRLFLRRSFAWPRVRSLFPSRPSSGRAIARPFLISGRRGAAAALCGAERRRRKNFFAEPAFGRLDPARRARARPTHQSAGAPRPHTQSAGPPGRPQTARKETVVCRPPSGDRTLKGKDSIEDSLSPLARRTAASGRGRQSTRQSRPSDAARRSLTGANCPSQPGMPRPGQKRAETSRATAPGALRTQASHARFRPGSRRRA